MSELMWSLDGRTYRYDEEVPIGCDDCNGCSKCCHAMGDSIILDPYDIWNLTRHVQIAGGGKVDFALLVSEDGPLEISMQRGLLLPNIKMVDEGVCPFLNERGRCSIHRYRTGLCRLYPLARSFDTADEESGTLSYFILNEVLGCPAENKSMVRIEDWLEIPDLPSYEAFQLRWHTLKKRMEDYCESVLSGIADSMEVLGRRQTAFLRLFYEMPYEEDFYRDFDVRCEKWINQN